VRSIGHVFGQPESADLELPQRQEARSAASLAGRIAVTSKQRVAGGRGANPRSVWAVAGVRRAWPSGGGITARKRTTFFFLEKLSTNMRSQRAHTHP
jgi:hypothetical protein